MRRIFVFNRGGDDGRMDMIQDERLVMRAKRGDGDAFGVLYERHVHAIFRYVMIRVGSREDAEDLVEKIFVKSWRSLDSYRARKASFRTWLYRIARNTIIDHYRQRTRECGLEEAHGTGARGPSPEDHVAAQEERTDLLTALGRLRPDHQEVIALRFADGLSHAEAADMMGRSEAAVRVLQHRALVALRQEMTTSDGGYHGR